MRILDLGCGHAKEQNAIGIDSVFLPGVDVVADLTDRPFPFADNTFDIIYLNDVIEHLPDTIGTMEEVYRIAAPGAKVFIRVVNWNSHYTAMDPTHVRAFTENSFDFFGRRQGRSYYTKARFDVINVGLQYNFIAQKYIRSKKILKFLSSYLCNILEGLNFELVAVKDGVYSPGKEVKDFIRCPFCIEEKPINEDRGILKKLNEHWLKCQETNCGKKFLISDGAFIMLRKKALKWDKIPAEELPDRSMYNRVPIE